MIHVVKLNNGLNQEDPTLNNYKLCDYNDNCIIVANPIILELPFSENKTRTIKIKATNEWEQKEKFKNSLKLLSPSRNMDESTYTFPPGIQGNDLDPDDYLRTPRDGASGLLPIVVGVFILLFC